MGLFLLLGSPYTVGYFTSGFSCHSFGKNITEEFLTHAAITQKSIKFYVCQKIDRANQLPYNFRCKQLIIYNIKMICFWVYSNKPKCNTQHLSVRMQNYKKYFELCKLKIILKLSYFLKAPRP